MGRETWATWLGEEPADPRRLKALLAPYPSEGTTCCRVSPRVGDVENNDASLVEPIGVQSMMPGWQSPKLLLLVWFLLTVALTDPLPAFAWGDEGHRVIALIAEHYLDPAARSKVATLLAADTDTLTAHDIASEATWADKYRDSDRNGTKIRYEATWRWHFVDVELAQPDLVAACFGHPARSPGIPASKGPPQACVVDKISQFSAELGDPATDSSRPPTLPRSSWR